MWSSLPNQLTLSRILAIPAIVVLLALSGMGVGAWVSWLALALFAAAGITDYFDGYLARANGQTSRIGQFLDPIADKLLIAAVVLMLVNSGNISGMTVLPAVIILLREVAVSGLREFLAGVQVSVPVSRLAKWKTAIQMLALGFLIMGKDGPASLHPQLIGDIGLWVAGAFTVVTGWDYWQAGLKHFEAPER